MPSGKPDEGEELSHGAARELCEETGLDLDPAHLRLLQAVHRRQSPEISRTGFFKGGATPSPRTRVRGLMRKVAP
ncbi:NUDIX domain-containing protein [Streptomyces triticiradicis]|uniref:NUDIX domain-containing protein n=1 Tax=Streptomyces triticiradicis TaxID=2651189 RepID=UPI00298DC762|nr:NUDIX domain-containing protein [Streptomyces triticiradicis]